MGDICLSNTAQRTKSSLNTAPKSMLFGWIYS